MDFETLSDSRAVGSFDLISPPLTPIGLIDAQQLLKAITSHVQTGSRHLVVDCSGLEGIYSDTLNALGHIGRVLQSHGCSLGVLAPTESIAKACAPLNGLVNCYRSEPELLSASVEVMNTGAVPPKAAPAAEAHLLRESQGGAPAAPASAPVAPSPAPAAPVPAPQAAPSPFDPASSAVQMEPDEEDEPETAAPVFGSDAEVFGESPAAASAPAPDGISLEGSSLGDVGLPAGTPAVDPALESELLAETAAFDGTRPSPASRGDDPLTRVFPIEEGGLGDALLGAANSSPATTRISVRAVEEAIVDDGEAVAKRLQNDGAVPRIEKPEEQPAPAEPSPKEARKAARAERDAAKAAAREAARAAKEAAKAAKLAAKAEREAARAAKKGGKAPEPRPGETAPDAAAPVPQQQSKLIAALVVVIVLLLLLDTLAGVVFAGIYFGIF